jgi:hypothetical protein
MQSGVSLRLDLQKVKHLDFYLVKQKVRKMEIRLVIVRERHLGIPKENEMEMRLVIGLGKLMVTRLRTYLVKRLEIEKVTPMEKQMEKVKGTQTGLDLQKLMAIPRVILKVTRKLKEITMENERDSPKDYHLGI